MKNGRFIAGTTQFNTFEQPIPAPYLRKSFCSDVKTTAKVSVAACGFYELYWNGKRCTKGFLAPYVSNPEHYIYYDEYELPVDEGENVIGLHLGNGFQNNPGGYAWDFDKASFRSAPMVRVEVTFCGKDGREHLLVSDKTFRTAESPVRSDDYRFGEVYDANCETEGWNEKGFDDSSWLPALEVEPPCGELAKCEVAPILAKEERKALEITKNKVGYIYDFGVSDAGACRLRIRGRKGQRIELRYADSTENGRLNLGQIWFSQYNWQRDKDIVHRDVYICKGEGEEVYLPFFTYHGFRYVEIQGIDDEQATQELLTYVVFHSDVETRGDFLCSDKTANTVQEITRRSDISNLHYIPTDCPQREKNGWTADAALSSEQMLLNFAPEREYTQWYRNICKAQNEEGALPGLVPTGGWGFEWGNGPAWDSVLAFLPYFTYRYRGETEMIRVGTEPLLKYLRYLQRRADENGLIHIGLGDWCHVGREAPKAPLAVTDTIMSMDIAQKTAHMLRCTGKTEEAQFAQNVAETFRTAIRTHLIDFETMLVEGNCQTSQAMAIYYNVFAQDEKAAAFDRLLRLIEEADGHMDVGVLGGRVLFHVLSDFGYGDLAFRMIVRKDFPSYGNLIERGATTLWENFMPDHVASMNHHFWGDVSSWFIQRIAGICVNPEADNTAHLILRPDFIASLDFAQAYHITNHGKVFLRWERDGKEILLTTEVPSALFGTISLPKGYTFEDGAQSRPLCTGRFRLMPQ